MVGSPPTVFDLTKAATFSCEPPRADVVVARASVCGAVLAAVDPKQLTTAGLVSVLFLFDGELLDESDVAVLTVAGVKSAKQLNSSAEYDVDDDEDVEAVLVVWLGSNGNAALRGGLKYKKIKI